MTACEESVIRPVTCALCAQAAPLAAKCRTATRSTQRTNRTLITCPSVAKMEHVATASSRWREFGHSRSESTTLHGVRRQSVAATALWLCSASDALDKVSCLITHPKRRRASLATAFQKDTTSMPVARAFCPSATAADRGSSGPATRMPLPQKSAEILAAGQARCDHERLRGATHLSLASRSPWHRPKTAWRSRLPCLGTGVSNATAILQGGAP